MTNQITDLNLKRLKRADLLEMLLASEKENERLETQLKQVTAQLQNKEILIEKSGSIAEAALQLNGVFKAAQNAATQYVETIQQQGEQLLQDTEERYRLLEQQTQDTCNTMLADAKEEIAGYWKELSDKLEQYSENPQRLLEMLALDVKGKYKDENHAKTT